MVCTVCAHELHTNEHQRVVCEKSEVHCNTLCEVPQICQSIDIKQDPPASRPQGCWAGNCGALFFSPRIYRMPATNMQEVRGCGEGNSVGKQGERKGYQENEFGVMTL